VTVDVGSVAPDFTLRDQHNQLVRLTGFRGRSSVLLFFYPWAFSGVCRGELREIQDDLAAFQNDGVQVLGVSVDSVFAQRVFAEREGLGFPLLSDFWPHGAVARSYGVFDESLGVAVRASFLVDSGGVVRWQVRSGISTARDMAGYRRALTAL
jgi:mycoredoxin-dependent peroxiredoxin